ncbi:hypothetical protein Ahu01nite_010800 [Winogradskya humida]|uniref:Recombination endonuclease VII n=1 Tax=Winogradskya humida TaxID=113566 RepID=A0ABQ3ZHN1_9ACTN|nr:hypothetical protein Ahu01nite_010800 [Actinoplanes humidus]
MNLRAKYGISVAEYDSLRAKQGYRCAICQRHEDDIPVVASGRPRRDGSPSAPAFKLTVDHCHTSLRVRGLLCSGCNAGLGSFRESVPALLAAVSYLHQT